MNAELYQIIQQAECRHLTDNELARVREYAVNVSARLEAARHVESNEDAIVSRAVDGSFARQPEAQTSSHLAELST